MHSGILTQFVIQQQLLRSRTKERQYDSIKESRKCSLFSNVQCSFPPKVMFPAFIDETLKTPLVSFIVTCFSLEHIRHSPPLSLFFMGWLPVSRLVQRLIYVPFAFPVDAFATTGNLVGMKCLFQSPSIHGRLHSATAICLVVSPFVPIFFFLQTRAI